MYCPSDEFYEDTIVIKKKWSRIWGALRRDGSRWIVYCTKYNVNERRTKTL
jgi:hypothetical protein